ncbi:carbonic anhydrase [Streptomyces sp. NPDC006339]|uniref:carbonic anhydrase n=1 Tax=Streptomyces sp. NPDC006339 TaxID=3156755 RepID=UPI0033B8D6CB
MFVSCSDARVVPALLTGSRPGDLYELRTYGGVVPQYEAGESTGESRTIERAVRELEITDIVICGHSDCGVVDKAVKATEEHSGTSTAGHWHTVAQLDALCGYPSIMRRLTARSLRLHAWFYEIETGAVLQYGPGARSFRPL